MRLILFGPPGVGKGTQAKILSSHLNIFHISTGDILRQEISTATLLGLKAKAILEAGQLVSDDIMIGIIENVLKSDSAKNGFILDGFPRTVPQAEALNQLLLKLKLELDIVIFMEINEGSVIKRLSNRRSCNSCGSIYNLLSDKLNKPDVCPKCGGKLIQRDDDTLETIRKRLSVYESSTAPVKLYYAKMGLLKTVKAIGSIEEINKKILGLTNKT